MDRRNFLKRFIITVGAVAVIPRTVATSITEWQNPVKVFKSLNYERINKLVLKHYIPQLTEHLFENSILIDRLRSAKVVNGGEKIITPIEYKKLL